jgi:low temperature requirement protein LtrA
MKLRKDIIEHPKLPSEYDGDTERHADWLELLYDLIFVAAVSILALDLSSDYSFTKFLESIPIFFVIWWGWVGHTFYSSRFGTDDILHRALTLLQMLAVASLAVNVKGAWSSTGTGFALSYAFLRILLIVEYFRVGRFLPEARGLTNYYCIGFGIAASLWIISAFIPTPWRFIFWGVAIIIDLMTPITASDMHINLPAHPTHLPERFGLFTIIVIGEAVVSVVLKISSLGMNFITGITGMMVIIISFSIWWGYFEESRGAEAKVLQSGDKLSKYQLWLYSHFPLMLGIVTFAAGAKNIITLDSWGMLPANEIWLLCTSLAITFLSLNFIFLSSFSMEECENRVLQFFRLPYYLIIISVMLTGFLGNILPGAVILIILTVLCLLKVILSLRKPPQEAVCNL